MNPTLAAQQSAQAFPGGSGTPPNSSKSKTQKNKKKSSKYVRLKNIDRSSGQTHEITVGSVAVVITEYKPKLKRHDSSESYSESNDSLRS